MLKNIAKPGLGGGNVIMAADRPLVAVLDEGYGSYAIEHDVLASAGATLEVRPCGGRADAVRTAVRDAVAVLVRETPVDAAAIGGADRLRAIVRYGVGVDNIDLDAAAARRIYVANVPDYATEEVSDQALALLLAVVRRVVTRDRAVRAGAWNVARSEPMYRLAGKTLGLIGYGRIGRAFHRKARALGFARTLVFDPGCEVPPESAELTDVPTICRRAEVISLHAPLTRATRHVIGAAELALMKPTAVLVNASRGGLIDEAALAAALAEGRLFGAGLDVFEREPPVGSPLLDRPEVVLSDHTGWYSEESVADLQRRAAEEVVRVLRGETPRNWVNSWTTGES